MVLRATGKHGKIGNILILCYRVRYRFINVLPLVKQIRHHENNTTLQQKEPNRGSPNSV